jgi:hypothetical protein
MPIPAGGRAQFFTQHQSHETETDSQRNTCDGSSGQPGAPLEISYFTGKLKYIIFYNTTLGLGKTTNSQDRFPAIQLLSQEKLPKHIFKK